MLPPLCLPDTARMPRFEGGLVARCLFKCHSNHTVPTVLRVKVSEATAHPGERAEIRIRRKRTAKGCEDIHKPSGASRILGEVLVEFL